MGRAAAGTPTARTPSTWCPTRATSRWSSPRPAGRSWSSGSASPIDSGGPGRYRGGLGYDKHIRMLRDGHFMSIADRSVLACWGVRGGRAGQPFSVVIDPGGAERARRSTRWPTPSRYGPARSSGSGPRAAAAGATRSSGRTTRCSATCAWGKVSLEGAWADYGVCIVDGAVDAAGSDAERRSAGPAHRRRAVLRPRPRLPASPAAAPTPTWTSYEPWTPWSGCWSRWAATR